MLSSAVSLPSVPTIAAALPKHANCAGSTEAPRDEGEERGAEQQRDAPDVAPATKSLRAGRLSPRRTVRRRSHVVPRRGTLLLDNAQLRLPPMS